MPTMPSPCARVRRAPVLLAVALGAAALTGCGSDPVTPSGPRPVVVEPENPSVASSVADPTTPRIVSVVVTDGSTTGDTGTVDVRQNAPVRLVVISDTADTVVVEGYDLTALATAEVPVQLEFLAARQGTFRVVLRDSGLELTTLRVG